MEIESGNPWFGFYAPGEIPRALLVVHNNGHGKKA
jgi:hypothetical protein